MGLFNQVRDRLAGGTAAKQPVFKQVTEEQVLESLKQVVDPDLHKDIVTLGFVQNVNIKGTSVSFEVNLTTPACPVKDLLKKQSEDCVAALPGVDQVDVTMTATTRGHVPTQKVASTLSGVKNIIAVASGKGGVGKSTSAVNLAYALAASGSKVGLLDADIYGPSIPRMTTIDSPAGGSGQIISPPAASGVKVISVAMFQDAGKAAILRGPMAASVIKQFLTQVDWGELDYLIIDYPPGTGDIQLTISQTVPITGAVIVTTPQEVSLLDVRKAIGMFKTLRVPVLGVLETMSYFLCDGCDKKHFIFREGGGQRLIKEHGLAFLGAIPMETSVAEGTDQGAPQVTTRPESLSAKAYIEAAGGLAQQISILNSQADGRLKEFSLDWN